MRDYIILNGVNSNTITGLLISTLPPITKPKIRTQTEEIDGRDGDIVTKLGYSAYTKEFTIGLYGNFDIDEVIAFFNSEGTVVFSNENDKYYNYQIIDQIDYDKLIRFKKASVKMHVQPFKYPLEETPVEITIETLNNEAEEMSIGNTSDAPITLALKGNTSQDSTPAPDAPVEVKTVTGGQNITVCGKNLANISGIDAYRQGITFKEENGYLSITGTSSSGYTSYDIEVNEIASGNTIYLYSPDNTGNIVFYARKSDSSNIGQITNGGSLTLSGNMKYLRVNVTDTNLHNDKFRLMLSTSSITTYQPYQSQSYEINLGKNLFNYNDITTSANYINNYDGSFTRNANGTNILINVDNASVPYDKFSLKAGTYSVSFDITTTNAVNITNFFMCTKQSGTTTNLSKTLNISIPANTKTHIKAENFIVVNDAEKVGFAGYLSASTGVVISNIQVEKGATATTYAPYKTPIEICKIGTYQDYIYKEAGKWYIEKQVGKVVIDGNETGWTKTNSSFQLNNSDTDITKMIANVYTGAYCTDYKFEYYASSITTSLSNYAFGFNSVKYLTVRDDRYSTANDYKTYLNSNNKTFYIPLATPTTTEITDAELIGQLNAIENARSYDPTTNISQNTSYKPFIVNATAVKKGTDTGIVDNEGNIYAKPTIDIEGSGTVGIYLDGNQMFSVDLSNATECIIDTTSLEAYNPTTSALMNRQVTGDYSNFKLNAGENEIKVSGSVTKATITNYTRWL